MEKPLYPNLAGEMAKRGENVETIANLLQVSKPTVYSRLQGDSDFRLGEVEKLCEHYGMDYETLFSKVV
jgi:predicted transcriptional regulator